jgi:hypothetical protein
VSFALSPCGAAEAIRIRRARGASILRRTHASLARALGLAVFAPFGIGLPVSAAWYDPAWSYRQKITISSSLTTADLTDFALLVKIDIFGNGVFTWAQADGDDILFTDSDGTTKLDHEIERFDAGTEELWAWVRLPALSSSTPTELYIYYGNPNASNQEDENGVWDSDFQGVWHLHDDFLDSTVNAKDGTNNATTNAAGQVADSQNFSGANEWIGLGLGCFVTGTWTVEAWIRPVTPTNYRRVFYQGGVACPSRQLTLYWHSGHLEVATDTANGTPDPVVASGAVSSDVWTHVVWTFDGSTHTLYLDGASSSGSTAGSGLELDGENYIGRRLSGSYWSGDLDEIRVSDAARSSTWIGASYRNQDDPVTYQTLGSEERYPLTLVKRAFLTDGTAITGGLTLPKGTPFKFLLYIDNAGAGANDITVQDVLATAFQYQASTIKVDDTLVSATVCPGGICDEEAIFAQVDGSGTALGDGDLDGDVASYSAGSSTVDFGNGNNANNASLNMAADRVWAAIFTIKMQ